MLDFEMLKDFGIIGLLLGIILYIILKGRLTVIIKFPRDKKDKSTDDE